MTTKALLESNPDPTEQEIKFALAGNLCRCNAYGRIIAAVRGRGPAGEGVLTLDVVGQRVVRRGLREKLTGEARYSADLKLPGMLHGAVLRSPHPHANVLNIDTSAAASLPGVQAILTPFDTDSRASWTATWGCWTHGCATRATR